MDPKLVEVMQLFARFKAAYHRSDLDVCSNFLSQLKALLTKFPSLPPLLQQTPNAVEELKLARDIYDHAVLSVKIEDQDAFEGDFCQLKPYYMDTCSDEELQQYISEEHPEWDVRNGRVFFQKAMESQPCKETPAVPVINKTLGYAKGLERTV